MEISQALPSRDTASPSKSSVDRTFLARLLQRATTNLVNRTKSQEVASATLGSHMRELLRVSLGDANVELDGALFGPILYPRASPEVYPYLKFRNFLAAFPEIVLLRINHSGDTVFLLNPGQVENPVAGIDPGFAPASGETTPIVEQPVVDSSAPVLDTNPGTGAFSPSSLPGFFIVESVSIVQTIHEIFGAKPQPKGLPQWDAPMRWVRSNYPGQAWKALYFMCLDPKQVSGTEGFQSYLKAVGFEVIILKANETGEAVLAEERLAARAKANAIAVSRGIDELASREACGPIVVVSHSQLVLKALDRFMDMRGKEANVVLLGLREFLPDSVVELETRGLQVVDLEHGVKSFKMTLPRQRQMISAESFDPKSYFSV